MILYCDGYRVRPIFHQVVDDFGTEHPLDYPATCRAGYSYDGEPLPNYLVVINSWHHYHCATVEEVWNTIGRHSFGSTHMVYSPVGLDTAEFVPF